MKPTKIVDLVKIYNGERIYLGLLGFYPIAKDKYSNIQKIAAVLCTAIHLLYLGLGSTFAFLNMSNVELFAGTCSFLLTDLAILIKMLNFFFQRKNLLVLEDMLNDPLFTELEEDEETILKQSLKISKFIEIVSAAQITFNIIFELIYPVIYRHFFLLMWFPFKQEDHFWTVYIFHSLIDVTGASFDVAADVLNLLLLDICSTQFLLLKDRLLKIGSTSTGFEDVDNKQRVKLLKKYIEHHGRIYSLCDLVQEIFTIGMFVQISGSAAILCFSLFLVLLTPIKTLTFGILLGYAYYMMWQLTTYFYVGQKILDSSSTISEACYSSKWYDCSVEVQKYLLVIMNRASSPVNILACGIFALNFQTYMTILSTAYSFFTLVWKIYTDN